MGVSVGAVEQLAATKPWVRFISVIIFIGAGFMLLGAIAMIVAGSAGLMLGAAGRNAPSGFAGPFGMVLAAVYAVFAFVYIFPGVKLWKYANAIGSLIQTGSEQDLVAALTQQKSFWKFIGILMLAMLVIYVLAIIAGVAFAGFAAAAAKH